MDLDLRHNLKQAQRGLGPEMKLEMRKALRRAINATLMDVLKNTIKRLPKVLDRPTRFTMKAFRIRYASNRTLRGSVHAKDIQAKYLLPQEVGGTVEPEGRAIPVPGEKQRLNKHGNLARGTLKRGFANRTKFFSGTPGRGLPAGLWQRMGKAGRTRLKMVALWAERAFYSKKPLKFKASARKTADARLPVHLDREVTKALAPKD